MEIGDNNNFDDLNTYINKLIQKDFMSYLDNGGNSFTKDLKEVDNILSHHLRLINKLTAKLKQQEEGNQILQKAIQYNSDIIQNLCREIINLKKD